MSNNADSIFKKGSKTYYFSSLFFPKKIREKVTTLYAYVRTVDDFVDTVPPNKESFISYKKDTQKAESSNEIVNNFLILAKENGFQKDWIDAFLSAMEHDLNTSTYDTFKELESYIYGSANVIGYMMSALMNLPEKAFIYAGLQGKAMQLINFIRDIKEDTDLGRTYIPLKDMELYNVSSLQPKTSDEQYNFSRLIQFEIERYYRIQEEAQKGYMYIPKQYLIPIKTAADLYKWTAKKIYANPMIVFEKKVKPSKLYMTRTIITNYITL